MPEIVNKIYEMILMDQENRQIEMSKVQITTLCLTSIEFFCSSLLCKRRIIPLRRNHFSPRSSPDGVVVFLGLNHVKIFLFNEKGKISNCFVKLITNGVVFLTHQRAE